MSAIKLAWENCICGARSTLSFSYYPSSPGKSEATIPILVTISNRTPFQDLHRVRMQDDMATLLTCVNTLAWWSQKVRIDSSCGPTCYTHITLSPTGAAILQRRHHPAHHVFGEMLLIKASLEVTALRKHQSCSLGTWKLHGGGALQSPRWQRNYSVTGLKVWDEAEQNVTARWTQQTHGWSNCREWLWVFHGEWVSIAHQYRQRREGKVGKMGRWTAETGNYSTDMWNQDANFTFSLSIKLLSMSSPSSTSII
jgi:hypothetical protein